MRVELKISGGFGHFPGLARPLVVESSALPGGEAAHLRDLCASAIVDADDGAPAPGEPMPDARTYRLTIAGEGSTRKIACADPLAAGPLAELIAFVQEHGTR